MISIPPIVRLNIREDKVIAVNLHQISSLAIEKQASLKRPKENANPDTAPEFETYTADVIRFYFPNGTGLNFEVGKNITAEEFEYAVSAIAESLYKTHQELEYIKQAEHEAKKKAFESAGEPA